MNKKNRVVHTILKEGITSMKKWESELSKVEGKLEESKQDFVRSLSDIIRSELKIDEDYVFVPVKYYNTDWETYINQIHIHVLTKDLSKQLYAFCLVDDEELVEADDHKYYKMFNSLDPLYSIDFEFLSKDIRSVIKREYGQYA